MSNKGVIFSAGLMAATLVVGGLMVLSVRLEITRLIEMARHVEPEIAGRVVVARGVGGLGRYLVIKTPEGEAPLNITECPLNIPSGICVRLP